MWLWYLRNLEADISFYNWMITFVKHADQIISAAPRYNQEVVIFRKTRNGDNWSVKWSESLMIYALNQYQLII